MQTSDQPTSVDADGLFEPFHISRVPSEEFGRGERFAIRHLSAGDYVCFPAGQKAGHALVNRTDSPCRYLVLGNPHPHDVVAFTETGRVGVKLTGEGYRRAATSGYWDDVDTGEVSGKPEERKA
jgi:hypothetical protein